MAIKKYLFLFSAFLSFLTLETLAYSQEIYTGKRANTIITGAEIVRSSKNSELPSYIKFKADKRIRFSALEEWAKNTLQLNPDFSFKLKTTEKDQLGFIHYRLQQTYKDTPIEAATWIVHTKNDIIHTLNGQLYGKMPVTNTPTISEETALEKAKEYVNATIYKWEIPAEETHLKWESNNPKATYFPKAEIVYVSEKFSLKEESFKLAYKFNIYAHQPLSRSYIFVDASTGKIIGENAIIHHADTPGTAETVYSGSQPIIADSFAGGFRLRDASRGLGIRTFDLNNAYGYGGAIDFVDADNNWNNVNPEQDEYAGDAHWGTEVCYDYFNLQHGRNSIDGAGFQLNSYVHYGVDYVNAFWDGTRMTYGDGNGAPYSPLTSLDIAGHEITHGLTNFTANLIYDAEPGALNESFSDIFGTAIENYGRPGAWDWLLSNDIGAPFRSLQDPNTFNHPDTYFGTFWAPLAGPDHGGVHTNSGVQNYWYYLLCEGGSGVNDIGDAYTVNAIGMNSASAIAFRNLTVYLTEGSDHDDARFYAIQSAIDLFGACSVEEEETTNAWYAVGVGDEYVSNVTANFTAGTGCFPEGTIDFSDASSTLVGTIDTWAWDFGDGSTSTLTNPSHNFGASGTYTVELTATNSFGCENITTLDVNVFEAPNVNFSAANFCEGSLTNFTNETTIGTGTITDWLWNFGDATSTVENPTHTFSGAGSYNVKLVATSDNGCLDSVTIPININPLPNADFTFTNDCFYNTANFVNTSTITSGLISSYNWNFGDGSPINTDESPNHNYTTSGTYDVTLNIESDAGCESTITHATSRFSSPIANFSVEDICESETANFTDLSTIDAPEEIATRAWDFGDGTTEIAISPTHNYTASGIFNVTLTTTSTNGCENEITLPLQVNPNPIANFSTSNGCVNGNATIFTDLSTATEATINNWLWNFDDGTSATESNPTKKFIAAGNYNVSLTVIADNDCQNAVTIPVTIFEKPTANFASSATTICSSDCIELTDLSSSPSSSINTWTWNIGNDEPLTEQNPSICFNQTEKNERYDVQLIVSNDLGCKDTMLAADLIDLNITPTANFSFDNIDIDILHPEINLTNTSENAVFYSWNFGDNSGTSSDINPSYTYQSNSNTYEVTLQSFSANGSCSSVAKKMITIKDVVLYYIPNTFTPDGDLYNQTFAPIFKSGYDPYNYHFIIYNRWGEVLFESFDATIGWDGTYGNLGLAESGVYVWKVSFKHTMSDEIEQSTGHLTLIR